MDENTRGNVTMKVGIVGILGNLMLFIIKIAIAFVSKSQALLADSVNSGTDIISSIMTWIGGKISSEPSDSEHNYGHGKAEYIFSLLISIVMAYLALKIAFDSIVSLGKPSAFEVSFWFVLTCLITIGTKLGMYFYVHKLGKATENILILANAQDHVNDVCITSSVLLGAVFCYFGFSLMDRLIAIGIAIKIIIDAIKIFMTSYNVLMDTGMSKEELDGIRDMIALYPTIDHVDKITSKSVGNKFIVIIKISIDGNMTVNEGHSIAGKLKADVLKLKDVYDVIVHVNPV